MRDEPIIKLMCLNIIQKFQKEYYLIMTAGRWSWKSKIAKNCVTTYLPNRIVFKMDNV
jgi:hypothetical protein